MKIDLKFPNRVAVAIIGTRTLVAYRWILFIGSYWFGENQMNTFRPYVAQQKILTHMTVRRKSVRRWSGWVRQTHVYAYTVRFFYNRRYEEEPSIVKCVRMAADCGMNSRERRKTYLNWPHGLSHHPTPQNQPNNKWNEVEDLLRGRFSILRYWSSKQFPYLILTIDLVKMNIQLRSPLRTKSKQRNFDRAIQRRCDFEWLLKFSSGPWPLWPPRI